MAGITGLTTATAGFAAAALGGRNRPLAEIAEIQQGAKISLRRFSGDGSDSGMGEASFFLAHYIRKEHRAQNSPSERGNSCVAHPLPRVASPER